VRFYSVELENCLSTSKDIFLAPPKGIPTFYTFLRSIGRSFSRFKVFHPLRSIYRSVLYTAEPAGKVAFRSTPVCDNKVNCDGITVLSANLWHDWPRYREISQRLDAFLNLVEREKADIILLQEVARTTNLHVDEWLADQLGMAFVYSRANGHRDAIGFEEGLAVLSRYPLSSPKLQQLEMKGNPFVRRIAVGANVHTSCGNLMAFSVHLGLMPNQNVKQLNRLQGWVASLTNGMPALIGGDFNAHENKPQIAMAKLNWVDTFRHLNLHADGTTHELRAPWGQILARHRLDYIFLQRGSKRWQILEARHLEMPDVPHSDHRAVLTRLIPATQSF
jgi:beta-glucosidase